MRHKFLAIEGLRGWLAWTVVLSHLAQVTNIYALGLGPQIVVAGQTAVLAFIVISGFVITHLLIEKKEPYFPYIARRFMRIFPLFAATCVIGFFTSDIFASSLARLPWASDQYFDVLGNAIGTAQSTHDHFWAHVVAHATMLHGTISDNLLPYSLYAFNGPAWSLSLEWQFYLLAPLIIPIFQRSERWAATILGLILIGSANQIGAFGSHKSPSFLPSAATYFAIGITGRIIFSRLPSLIQRPGIFAILLESRLACFAGSRSYSVYLIHAPVIVLALSFWVDHFPNSSKATTLCGLFAIVIPITAALAEIAYRGIEQPGIALGSRIAKRITRLHSPTSESYHLQPDRGHV